MRSISATRLAEAWGTSLDESTRGGSPGHWKNRRSRAAMDDFVEYPLPTALVPVPTDARPGGGVAAEPKSKSSGVLIGEPSFVRGQKPNGLEIPRKTVCGHYGVHVQTVLSNSSFFRVRGELVLCGPVQFSITFY
jgi:hypothetical protein